MRSDSGREADAFRDFRATGVRASGFRSGASRTMIEELDELGALALGEAAHRLRLADAALVQEPRGLHAPELGDGHEHVEDLRGGDELGRVEEYGVDLDGPRLQVALELGSSDSDVVRPLKRFHPLVERTCGRLRVRLRADHEPDESTKTCLVVKREHFGTFAGIFSLPRLSTEKRGRPIRARYS